MSEKHLGGKNNKAFKQFLYHILRKKGESVFIKLKIVFMDLEPIMNVLKVKIKWI